MMATAAVNSAACTYGSQVLIIGSNIGFACPGAHSKKNQPKGKWLPRPAPLAKKISLEGKDRPGGADSAIGSAPQHPQPQHPECVKLLTCRCDKCT